MCLQTWSKILLSSLCFELQIPGTLQSTTLLFVHFFVQENLILVLKNYINDPSLRQTWVTWEWSGFRLIRHVHSAIQSAILYHTRTAKQILSQGTLEGINETKCTQLLRMSLYRCCIHRENVSHCNWKKQYFKLKKLIHVLLTTCRLRI